MNIYKKYPTFPEFFRKIYCYYKTMCYQDIKLRSIEVWDQLEKEKKK